MIFNPLSRKAYFALTCARAGLFRFLDPAFPILITGSIERTESAGLNRHIVGDARALQERRSDSILASSLALESARDFVGTNAAYPVKNGSYVTLSVLIEVGKELR
jgi:hypothetical protein